VIPGEVKGKIKSKKHNGAFAPLCAGRAPALQSRAERNSFLQIVFSLAEDFFGGVLDFGEDVVAAGMSAAVVLVMLVRCVVRGGGVMCCRGLVHSFSRVLF
jgi:hypothetical protein